MGCGCSRGIRNDRMPGPGRSLVRTTKKVHDQNPTSGMKAHHDATKIDTSLLGNFRDELEQHGEKYLNKASELGYRGFELGKFLDYYGQLGTDQLMSWYDPKRSTTSDVVRGAIIPSSLPDRTQDGVALAPLIQGGPLLAQHLVSHTWTNRFVNTAAAMVAEALGHPNYKDIVPRLERDKLPGLKKELERRGKLTMSFWFCAVSVNQHASICDGFAPQPVEGSPKWEFEEWESKRRDTVKTVECWSNSLHGLCKCSTVKHRNNSPASCEMNKFDVMMKIMSSTCRMHSRVFALVVAVDQDLLLFYRVWCIAELVQARKMEVPINIKFASKTSITDKMQQLSKIRVQDCRATFKDDKEEVLQKIGGEDKRDKFNVFLRDMLFDKDRGIMRAWEDEWMNIATDLSYRGFELAKLLDYYGQLGQHMPWYDPKKSTTNDVVRLAIIPSTFDGLGDGVALATMLQGGPVLPERYVQYMWSGLFSHSVAGMVAEALGKGTIGSILDRLNDRCLPALMKELDDVGTLHMTFWLDIVSINLHSSICGGFGPQPSPEWGENAMKSWERNRRDSVTGMVYPLCPCHTQKLMAFSLAAEQCETNKHSDTLRAMLVCCRQIDRDLQMVVFSDPDFNIFDRIWILDQVFDCFSLGVPIKVKLMSPITKSGKRRIHHFRAEGAIATRAEDLDSVFRKISNFMSLEDFSEAVVELAMKAEIDDAGWILANQAPRRDAQRV